jgi:hypothetical protein
VYFGFLIPLAVLLPNLIFALYPPVSVPPEIPDHSRLRRVTKVLERAGQAACIIIPCFYSIRLATPQQWAALTGMVLVLACYYGGWARYLRQGRAFRLLFSPMLGIPLFMAVVPVVYFLLAAVLLGSPWLAIGAVILALGHIPVSARAWRRANTPLPEAPAQSEFLPKKQFSPDGRWVVEFNTFEMRMSHWVQAPILKECATGNVLLDLSDLVWSADEVSWDDASRWVTLGMRRYPGNLPSVILGIAVRDRKAELYLPQAMERLTTEQVPTRLEAYAQKYGSKK